jgi:hypothetical protein
MMPSGLRCSGGGPAGVAGEGSASLPAAGDGAPTPHRKRGRAKASAPRQKATAEISRLQSVLQDHARQLAALELSHRTLAAKARAAQIAVAHCLALLRLGALMQQRAGGVGEPQPVAATSTRGGSGGAAAVATTSSSAASADARQPGAQAPPQPQQQQQQQQQCPPVPPRPLHAPVWAPHLEQMRQQLEANGAARHVPGVASLATPASSDPAVIQAERDEIGWSPSAAAAAAQHADISTQGLRRMLRDFCQRAGHLYL